ncbi:RagB/SusD family nutrient uptake outer membrane protein [Siansivirga zeaxanthinifaciens]|uniref:Carbohydrate-binding protein SusD n=1 Tax=Siansivirga zeaxanthinifaciens CC-SAMT-1 TaxID=1454006 RepID=A0A0C5WNI7_9FLAO|nr:RagB/SusD family nutrient uptake outer membrane protein [Siansivirga zeaxanthinifaciens]AJR04465.1 carbohydrate-binding protein SusD [Siansivirga zeaxanthinifaciens CC-SAMT-1]
MKTYKYLFLLLISLSIIGCSNLEEEPVGLLAPEGFFKSTKDIQTAVNGAYGHMMHEDYWGRKGSLPIMLRSDMVSIGDPTTPVRRIDHDRFTVDGENGMITDSWPRSYQTIAAANQAIVGAEAVNVPDELKNPVTAQAYFVRAFMYFELVRLYGDIPYLDKPVTDAAAAGSISKTKVADVYTKIIADLEFAKKWLPDTQPTRSLPSKATAQSYLALVYLTMGQFDNANFAKAYTEAKAVIDNESKYELGLEPDFQDLFNATKTAASKEPLFILDYNGFGDGEYGRDYMGALTGIRENQRDGTGGGWSVAVPSLAVYTSWDSQDYRRAVSLDDTGLFKAKAPATGLVEEPYTRFTVYYTNSANRPHIAKYTRFPGSVAEGNFRQSSNKYIMMRYAEVLLIAAEALNEVTPGTTEADGYVDRVRERARNGMAGSTPSPVPAKVTSGMSQDAFRAMVLEERKWELAFELKRWFDIVRRKMGPTVFGASGLEGLKTNFNPARDYLYPLPNDELLRNPNLLPQNNEY